MASGRSTGPSSATRFTSSGDGQGIINGGDSRLTSGGNADLSDSVPNAPYTSEAQAQPQKGWIRGGFLDYNNILKAFVGSNYLSMPFAYSQAGVTLGTTCLVIIALLTDRCCNLIVKCKVCGRGAHRY
jgi:hypothetical protein